MGKRSAATVATTRKDIVQDSWIESHSDAAPSPGLLLYVSTTTVATEEHLYHPPHHTHTCTHTCSSPRPQMISQQDDFISEQKEQGLFSS